jgi:hypothetical protein
MRRGKRPAFIGLAAAVKVAQCRRRAEGGNVVAGSPIQRAGLGFVAAALAVLTFHQGMWALLHVLDLPGLAMPPPYPMRPVPPLGVPEIFNLCFWGGLYGLAFGLLAPKLPRPLWLCGLATGIIAVLVGMFVVAGLKGEPVGGGWVALNWLRSLLINGCWGVGLGLIYPVLARALPSPAVIR